MATHRSPRSPVALLPFVALVLFSALSARAAAPSSQPAVNATISYQLPLDGPLPRTWRVTLAIVDPKNPDWLISQFVRGAPRTVTQENQGKFTEIWDGLDDNFMPVPPGRYGVKGIYMPADKWQVDGEYHSITPKFVTGASAWLPTPEQWGKPEPFGGDPTDQPLGAVAVGPNGIAVFYYVYLENGLNCPMIDLNKPINYEQFVRAFNSGGAAGGTSVATDGESVWAFSTDGGPKFVYRADQKPFGHDAGANRHDIYRPEGWVLAMTCLRDAKSGKSFVYIAQGGKIIEEGKGNFTESVGQRIDKITVHAGENGKLVGEIPFNHAFAYGLAVHAGKLYSLRFNEDGQSDVFSMQLQDGLPAGKWESVLAIPFGQSPSDLAVDSHGRIYVSFPVENKVRQYSPAGKLLTTYGRLAEQPPGGYDPLTLMSPGKIAAWTDKQGNDRLIIVEEEGPNRASEWDADGKLIREFTTLQTHANDGYAVDPENPQFIYMTGQQHWLHVAGHQQWLVRWKVDYDKRTWMVDAVWPNVANDPKSPGLDHPQFIRVNGHEYLACGRSNNVYRHEGDRWLLSAAIIREKQGNEFRYYSWHDENGDGHVQEDEYRSHPLEMPGHFLRYHGNQWMDDLSLVAMDQGGRDVARLAPRSFDAHGNPIFDRWDSLLLDPIFESRIQVGKQQKNINGWNHPLDAIYGGNELADNFSSDWGMVDGSMHDGFYVVARGGHNFSANEGAQVKVSRYVPDDHGGYSLKWRTGREAMQRLAEPGEMYGAIHIRRPINGLLSVVDQSRCGILLYTENGLYVESIFPDGRRFRPSEAGVYPQPGEFFAGMVYPDPKTGKIYFGVGKYTPMLYEARGWSVKENPVQPLASVQPTVDIAASQIASPPEIALSVRGGAGAANVARFSPALGGASLDGSMAGWESCDPVSFSGGDQQNVEVRCLYDPNHLYLRWHARLGAKFIPKPLQPADRIFTHDRLADTLSFYLQSDANAKPGGPAEGRPGDVRMVFGLFNVGGKSVPVALGMYPKWLGDGKPSPLTYATPVGKAAFENVGVIPDVTLGSKIDDDGHGFVIAAAIPRSALPPAPAFVADFKTMANFSATFAGHNKFWWANRDASASRETYDEPTEARLYPGSWSPAQFQGLDHGVVIRNWLILGPFGGPGAEKFCADLGGSQKDLGREFCEAAHYPPDDGKIDFSAVYKGEQLTGYWPDPREIRWKPANIASLDTRVILGPSAQTWYGATWIYAPAPMELDFEFQSHPQTYLRYFLNDKLVQSGEIRQPKDGIVPFASKTLSLKQGWNQVLFRGYCVGYPPFRAGLILKGAEENLWRLKLSATPPP